MLCGLTKKKMNFLKNFINFSVSLRLYVYNRYLIDWLIDWFDYFIIRKQNIMLFFDHFPKTLYILKLIFNVNIQKKKKRNIEHVAHEKWEVEKNCLFVFL